MFRRNVKATWRSVIDFLLCSKFEWEQRIDEIAKVFYAHPPLSELWQESGNFKMGRTILVKNDFPYFNPDDAEQWVLWKLGGGGDSCCTEHDIDMAVKQLEQQSGPALDCLHWSNPPHRRSTPEMDHVHILWLKQGDVHNKLPSEQERRISPSVNGV